MDGNRNKSSSNRQRYGARGVGSRSAFNLDQDLRVDFATLSDINRFHRIRSSRRFRNTTNSCVLQGSKLVHEAMKRNRGNIVQRIFLNADAVQEYEIQQLVKRASRTGDSVPILMVDEPKIMRKMTGMEYVDIVAEVNIPQFMNLKSPKTWPENRPHSVLALDGVQDPGNVGTLIRTASLLGFDMVALGKGTVDPSNDKCLRASGGAVWDIPIFCGEIFELCDFLCERGRVLYAEADQNSGSQPLSAVAQRLLEERSHRNMPLVDESESIMQSDFATFCLVLGNEGQGIISATPQHVENIGPVGIPIFSSGFGLDSLGVASAGAILMHALSHRTEMTNPSAKNEV